MDVVLVLLSPKLHRCTHKLRQKQAHSTAMDGGWSSNIPKLQSDVCYVPVWDWLEWGRRLDLVTTALNNQIAWGTGLGEYLASNLRWFTCSEGEFGSKKKELKKE
jgi:hypothetical protein